MSLVADISTQENSLVTYKILVGDAKTDVSASFGVKTITVHRACNRIPTATLLLVDGDGTIQEFEASNAAEFAPGEKIVIEAGYEFEDAPIFEGIITKHAIKATAKTSYLLIECKDEAFKMTLGRKNKIFYEVTESDVIDEIISENGLSGSAEATSHMHNEIVQYQATDWDFIQCRAQINNMMCFVEDGNIAIKPPELSAGSVYTATYGDNVFSFEAEIDARNQYDTFEASSWNYSDQEVITKTAENSGLNSAGNLDSGALAEVAGSSSIALTHTGDIPDEILTSWAEGKSMYQQLAKICGTVQVQGTEVILPGTMITLAGMSDRFNGDVFVSGVHHTITNGNWTTTSKFGLDPEWFSETYKVSQLPASGMLPAISGLQIGVVSALEGDPKEEHRIQVKLPIISPEEEGVWARVLSLHAGEEYGVHFLPEIGNEVLVGFLNDDPNQAIVLGSLFSNTNVSPIEYSDDNFEKVIMTKSEIKITMNDELKSITLDTPAGKLITLDEDEGIIKLEDENSNIIIMDPDGITMESGKDIIMKATGDIKMEGINIEIVASAEIKAEGATATLDGAATTTISGGIVQIN
ncbi:type VI secretion system tip protein VgrG [Kordia sp. YSTF-M3]|uniref:Type VI secretion system tip protein VgrG n=1 Tax=Kordia aestuariivivens TaxID=2759037 RepID=A0ABR7QFN8_9FLAO|nr:type VI secretion system tip protein VgrG [Kordia aestuariivivens]MBC8757377.1 type VI secretion system tip protein VgrG [Kordia aestuariivivens]